MSGGSSGTTLPSILIQPRSSDGGQTMQIAALVGGGAVGDYFGNGVMTPDQSLAVNLRGDAATQAQRVTTASTGLYTWTYPVAFANGVVPIIECAAEGPDPQGGVTVNAQVEGTPTNTAAKIRITRTASTVVALIGLTILSISTSVATVVHLTARAPTA